MWMPKIPWITLEWPWPVLGLQPPFPVIMCYSLYLWVSLWQPLQWLIVIIPLFCLLVRTVLFYFLNYRPWPQKSRVLILVCTPFCTSRLCRRWKKCIHVSCSRIFNILCWVLFLFFNVHPSYISHPWMPAQCLSFSGRLRWYLWWH